MRNRRGKKQDYTKHEGAHRDRKDRRSKQVWRWDNEDAHVGHWEKVSDAQHS
jgi:hypothetical protein